MQAVCTPIKSREADGGQAAANTRPGDSHQLDRMERIVYSPSPELRSPSPAFSQSSVQLDDDSSESEAGDATALPGEDIVSPGPSALAAEPGDTVTCLWEDCGHVFSHLPTLIEHIHTCQSIHDKDSEHDLTSTVVHQHISAYTSRITRVNGQRAHVVDLHRLLALHSYRTSAHIPAKSLSHVLAQVSSSYYFLTFGIDTRNAECDKSFTRSDALAKHMRLQHNMLPPPSGRGGSRKRKRGESPQPTSHTTSTSVPAPTPTDPPSAFNTFKIEPRSPSEAGGPGRDYFDAAPTPGHDGEHRDDGADDDDEDDGLPPHLARLMDPQTGLVMGRSPSLVKYVIEKAKMRYALETHAALIEELKYVPRVCVYTEC